VHKSSLVGLAFGRQFASADCNLRVQAKHSTLSSSTTDEDASSDMPCRGGVLAVVLGVGNWHALSVCGVLSNQQDKDRPNEIALARMITTLELEVLHRQPLAAQIRPVIQ
jgi:hypothetical protein